MLPFSKLWYWSLLPLCLLAIAWELPVFNLAFFGDDLKLLHELRPLQAADVSTYLSPNWGWAYRPFMLIYWAGMMRLSDPVPHVEAFHLASVLLHVGSCCLASALCWRLLPATDKNKRSLAAFACGAAPFFWLGRSETLVLASDVSVLFCAFFVLCALHAFLSYRRNGHLLAALGVFAAFIAALGFKEEAVAIPLLCVLVDVCFSPSKLALRARTVWPYVLMGVVMCGFIALSLQAQAFIDPIHPKIIPIPRHISLLNVGDFYMVLLGGVLSATPWLNLATTGALGALVLRQKNAAVTGAFGLVAAISAPVPLMTGGYSSVNQRFFYLPTLFLVMAVVVLLCTSKVRASRTFPVVGAAFCVGEVRHLFDFFAGLNALQSELMTGAVTVPCILVGVVLLSLCLWRQSRLDGRVAGAVIAVAVCAQSNVFPAVPWFATVCGLLAFAVCGLLFERENKGEWIEGVLVAAALWQIPALTLPLMLTLVLLQQQKFAARLGFASLPLRTPKEHHAHL